MAVELRRNQIGIETQVERPVIYRGEEVGRQRYDLLVEDRLVVELKTVTALDGIHFSQTRAYLKALKFKHGLLLNFGAMPLTIKRVIYDTDNS